MALQKKEMGGLLVQSAISPKYAAGTTSALNDCEERQYILMGV